MPNDSIEILASKDGNKTCKINGIFLHSFYNPVKEAERFVSEIKTDFDPSNIVVIEPGYSYVLPFLKKKFPFSRLCAVRHSKLFSDSDSLWDYIFDSTTTSDGFYNFFGEEKLFSTLFIEWPASGKIFSQESKILWTKISEAVKKARDVLGTREFFCKRWISNKINFFNNVRNVSNLIPGSKDVFIAASGPSLENCFSFLRENRSKIFLVSLSSACSPLINEGIIPDLCISTDGGWWAKKHIEELYRYEIPLAVSTEAACPKKILQSRNIIPLCYTDDFISQKLFSELKIPFLAAKRNGTVSGTALELMLSLTDGNIFFGGLDLLSQKTFQHTQPNKLEIFNSQFENRIKTKSTRLTPGSFLSPSLKLYENWFSENSSRFEKRVFRIKGASPFKNSLGSIKEITPEEIPLHFTKCREEISFTKITSVENSFNSKIQAFVKEISQTEEWKKELFPSLYVMHERDKNNTSIKDKLYKKNEELLTHIYRLLK